MPLDENKSLFHRVESIRSIHSVPPVPPAIGHRVADHPDHGLDPTVDDRMLEIFRRAADPNDPIELRDLWLGRVECETGRILRPKQAELWRTSHARRSFLADEVFNSRAAVRFVKEMFNAYFRDDLYGELRSVDNLILSSGSVDEQEFGLPEVLKACVRYALDRDWYGYSDSRGRTSAREAIAAYESARITGRSYTVDNVAITLGGTSAMSGLADMILSERTTRQPALCAIPNYPALVESVARRSATRLVPLPCRNGEVSLAPLIDALTPATPLVLLQTVANPTGAVVPEEELVRLIRAASSTTMIILDECHEWLGPLKPSAPERAAGNVIRVSSISKTWSAPGLKIGWILADAAFIAEYYEYASTSFGGPPSFFYTLVEVLARMERWVMAGLESTSVSELREFEAGYGLSINSLQTAFQSYRCERLARDSSLARLRAATVQGLAGTGAIALPPRYSINIAVDFPGYSDSYRCFRELLSETGVSVFPCLLTFCMSGGTCRVTSARPWHQLAKAVTRIKAFVRPGSRGQNDTNEVDLA